MLNFIMSVTLMVNNVLCVAENDPWSDGFPKMVEDINGLFGSRHVYILLDRATNIGIMKTIGRQEYVGTIMTDYSLHMKIDNGGIGQALFLCAPFFVKMANVHLFLS